MGPAILGRVHTILGYVQTARRAMPSKQEAESLPPKPRATGEDIRFWSPAALPRFWLQKSLLSGSFQGITASGLLQNATSSPPQRVKRSESGMILDPITLNEKATLADALKIMKEHKIGGIPVINENRKLLGILTNRDLRFEKITSKKVTEIMTTENLITGGENTDLAKAEEILQEYKIEKLPIIDKDGKLKGIITYKDILKKKDRPDACKDEYGRLRVGAAVGVTADLLERIDALKKAGVDIISIDTAHGHSKGVIKALKEVKAKLKYIEFIALNDATGEGA
jgi:IMP dehydrogenase